jgi:hypothetical protein
MNAPWAYGRTRRLVCLGVALSLTACGGDSDDDDNPPPPLAPAAVTLSGIVSDGPVSGGAIFVFAADAVQAALDAVQPGGDRHAALAGAQPLAVLQRDTADEAQFEIDVPGEHAGAAVFLVFDNADAEDEEFRDTPPNLESLTVLGDAGATQRLNVTPHTTLIAQQVRALLDPDGDGVTIDVAAIQSEIAAAETRVLDTLGQDSIGRDLFPDDASPLDSEDDEVIHSASSALGLLVRATSAGTGAELDAVLEALAADVADGDVDGEIAPDLEPSDEVADLAEAVSAFVARGSDDELAMFAVGPCSSSAVALRRSCDVDVLDGLFTGHASCADMAEEDERADCAAEVEAESDEMDEECDDVFEARLDVCAELEDSAHEPAFGPAFADSFVDPLKIGSSVAPNPYFPLVSGNEWIYEGVSVDDEGNEVIETNTVSVTDRTKLIDGVTCLVVHDVATVEGHVIEDTEDWVAQDIDGNVWYCGEIAQSFETFEGDEPVESELVDVEGSWKAGRDGAEPGILFPASPEVGAVVRQEVAWGEAEDIIEIADLAGSETAPGGACTGTCLVTRDTTPLEPDVEEIKYYAPGVGLIVETAEDERVELIQFTPAP